MRLYLASYSYTKLPLFGNLENLRTFRHLSTFNGSQGTFHSISCGELIDSGLYSVYKNNKDKIDWDSYIDKYADYVKSMEHEAYIEADTYMLIGINKTEKLRSRLYNLISEEPIVVYHPVCGFSYFLNLCQNFNYVAIPTTWLRASRNISLLAYLILIAHSNNCKIHGLGYTDTSHLYRLKFDSIDSTSWLAGGRFGRIFNFRPPIMVSQLCSNTYKINARALNEHNFKQWLMYQRWLLTGELWTLS